MKFKLVFVLILLSCKSRSLVNSSHAYYGFCQETEWILFLKNDSMFQFKSDGHFGNTITVGKYLKEKDTIKLIADSTNALPIQNKINVNFFSIDMLIIDSMTIYNPLIDCFMYNKAL